MIVCTCTTDTLCTTIVVVPLRMTDRATGSDLTPKVFPRKKSKLKCEMIWKLWKKSKLKCEMICNIWKKSKLKCEMICKIWKKSKSNSVKIWKIQKKIVKKYGKYEKEVS